MREKFKSINFTKESSQTIATANSIIEDYSNQGLTLTLRQLFYQFVSKDIIPNTERSYKNLGNVISKGRLAGLIDWDAIEDRVRVPERPTEFENLGELVRGATAIYRLPRRRGQECYVELWVEKDALAGVLSPIARKYHVTLMVNRGYSSSSAMYESARRIHDERLGNESETATILYLGDMDPSGEDMVRDVADRLRTFGTHLNVEKIALTMDQVDEYKPPPNPAKLTDSRAKGYLEKFGDESWEVDALPPTALRDLIESALDNLTDQEMVDAVISREKTDKVFLQGVADGVKGER